MKKVLILSGKGGTGKTTTAAAFVELSKAKAFADCDVDAPNLHLVAKTLGKAKKSPYEGSLKAKIDEKKCIGCGRCFEKCRFHAIEQVGNKYQVKEVSCEGCGVCAYLCKSEAIELLKDVSGELILFKEEAVFSTAKLKMGRGNSGKLVSEVKKAMIKNAREAEIAIIDGSPGIGCPVIASINGVDLVLIVAEPSVSGISDMKRIIKTANQLQTKIAICVNKWDVSTEHTAEIVDFCREENLDFVGKIPYDTTVSKAMNEGKSLVELDCMAEKAMKEVYQNTMEVLLMD